MVHGGGGARVSMGILNELNGLNTERKMVIKKLPSGCSTEVSNPLERLPLCYLYSYREIVTNQVD